MTERARATGAVPAADVAPSSRPWIVTVAQLLLGVVVLVLLGGAAQVIEATIRVLRLLPQAAESTGATPSELADERMVTAVLGVVLTIVQVVIAAVLAALVIWVGSGRQMARVMLLVASGLLSTCCGSVAAMSTRWGDQSGQSRFAMELDRLEIATQPSWVSAVEVLASPVAIGLPLVALVLLLLPASNRFFRRQRDATRPSTGLV